MSTWAQFLPVCVGCELIWSHVSTCTVGANYRSMVVGVAYLFRDGGEGGVVGTVAPHERAVGCDGRVPDQHEEERTALLGESSICGCERHVPCTTIPFAWQYATTSLRWHHGCTSIYASPHSDQSASHAGGFRIRAKCSPGSRPAAAGPPA